MVKGFRAQCEADVSRKLCMRDPPEFRTLRVWDFKLRLTEEANVVRSQMCPLYNRSGAEPASSGVCCPATSVLLDVLYAHCLSVHARLTEQRAECSLCLHQRVRVGSLRLPLCQAGVDTDM